MKPGNHAFATATVAIPARRSSFTIRSCNVPKARSIRPFEGQLEANEPQLHQTTGCVIVDQC